MSSWSDQIKALFSDCTLDRDDMHAYQDEAVTFLKKNPFCALFIDMGLGKTVSSLTAILDLVCEMEVDCVLVVAPLRVANETWPTEIRNWRHTASMTIARIRDEDVVDEVNAAGRRASQILKVHGTEDPRVQAFVRRHRELQLRRRAKSNGLAGAEITRYGRKHIDAAMGNPVTAVERKLYVKHARRLAAGIAVRAHKARNPATIYIINREQLEFLVTAWGRDWPYDTVFIDESSSLKDRTSNRWKALRAVRPLIKRMHQLTATPAAESYLHLWAQISLLDLGERLGKTYTEFTNKFFDHNKYTFAYTLKEGAEQTIAEKIADICLTMKVEDYLPLEKPVMEIRNVTLSAAEMAIYKQMESSSIVELDGREIEAETAAALSSKLLQISSGVLYETYLDEDFDTGDFNKVKKVHRVHDRKIEDLKSLVEEVGGENVLVSYHFKSSLARLQEAFPKAVVMDKEGSVVRRWNSGKVPMLLVHPQSAGHGLNLQKGGRHVVFFDLPWSLELYLQLIGRLARQGQPYVVFVHHIVARGTIDELVLSCLLQKQDAQEELFRMLKRLRKMLSRGTITT